MLVPRAERLRPGEATARGVVPDDADGAAGSDPLTAEGSDAGSVTAGAAAVAESVSAASCEEPSATDGDGTKDAAAAADADSATDGFPTGRWIDSRTCAAASRATDCAGFFCTGTASGVTSTCARLCACACAMRAAIGLDPSGATIDIESSTDGAANSD